MHSLTCPDPTASYVKLMGALAVEEALAMMLRHTAAAAVDPLP